MDRGAQAQNTVCWATIANQTKDFRRARDLMRKASMAAPGVRLSGGSARAIALNLTPKATLANAALLPSESASFPGA